MKRETIKLYTSTDLNKLNELAREIGFECIYIKSRKFRGHNPVWCWKNSSKREDYWTPELAHDLSMLGGSVQNYFSMQTESFKDEGSEQISQTYQKLTHKPPKSLILVERFSLRCFLDDVLTSNPIVEIQGRLIEPYIIDNSGRCLGSDLRGIH